MKKVLTTSKPSAQAWISILLVTFLFMPGCNTPSHTYKSSRLVISNVNIIPLDKDTVMNGMDVVIENDRIKDIRKHTANGTRPLEKAGFVEGTGMYLIPALIDCHVHYGSDATLFGTYDSLYLTYGVMNVLALNGTPQLLRHRDSIRKGILCGPDIQCSGPRVNDSAMTSLQAHELLQTSQKAGYNFVKIYSDLSKEAFDKISSEAHKYELRVAGHIPQRVTTSGVLHSNQELIVHAEEFLYNPPVNYFMGDIEVPEKPDLNFIPALADSVAFYQKAVSPTLIAYKSILECAVDIEGYVKTVPLALSDPVAIAWQWSKETSFIPGKFRSSLSVSRLRLGYDYQLKLVSAFKSAGVLLLAGTDAPTLPGLVPGYSLHKEMQLLCEAGLTPYEALKTATINPARFLKIDARFGTIEVGKEGSFLLLRKNPLDDIANSSDIESVFKKGEKLKSKVK